MSVRVVLLTLIVVVSLRSTGTARAAFMLVPTSLNPGDQFRAVFLSSTSRDARSANIADYDQFITNLAVTAGLDTYFGAPVTWRAIGLTATVAAVDRLPKDFGSPPLYRLDGGLVAPSAGKLWVTGPTGLTIRVTESGVDLGDAAVWTGTLQDGTPSSRSAPGSSSPSVPTSVPRAAAGSPRTTRPAARHSTYTGARAC
jgi:hypothetical protein